jgi:hypothetical protein
VLTYDGEDFFPEEFLKKEHEYTRAEEALAHGKKGNQAQIIRNNNS